MILDYVKNYGSSAFSDVGINYLDLLVFAELSCFDYPEKCFGQPLAEALPKTTKPTIESLSGHARIVSLDNKEDDELRELVCRSARYGNARVLKFASDYQERKQQFAALALSLDDVTIIAFRGTDETVTGWHESLQLSLDEPVGSQIAASKFFEDVALETSGPIILCGHSKGGNLAEYSATVCANASPETSPRIAAIASFDGLGLPPRLRETAGYSTIADKTAVFIPKSSFIGNIHEHPKESVEFIDSLKVFIAQHYIYWWKTDGTHFVPHKQSMAGRLGSAALNLLIDNMNDNQKNKLFNILFAIPRALGKQTLSGNKQVHQMPLN